jgi:oligopeptide transport system ATP-binding protein
MTADDSIPALQIDSLTVAYPSAAGISEVVRDVSLVVRRGECLGIVGESGSGKTQIVLAVMGLLGARARASGSVKFGRTELLSAPKATLDTIRGARLAMIFQDPLSALTPHLRIGVQLGEVSVRHAGVSWREAHGRSLAMLQRVRMPDPERCLRQYPHELSGGMRQRVMIAMSLLCAPDLIIADEPTTALDVTVQAQIVDLLRAMRQEFQMGLILISHDLGLIARLAERILVVYAGRVVESLAVADLPRAARHPYTAALMECAPSLTGRAGDRMPTLPGQPPGPESLDQGCAFAPRCTRVQARCTVERPRLRPSEAVAQVACHYPLPA